jgi:hypothetical protein
MGLIPILLCVGCASSRSEPSILVCVELFRVGLFLIGRSCHCCLASVQCFCLSLLCTKGFCSCLFNSSCSCVDSSIWGGAAIFHLDSQSSQGSLLIFPRWISWSGFLQHANPPPRLVFIVQIFFGCQGSTGQSFLTAVFLFSSLVLDAARVHWIHPRFLFLRPPEWVMGLAH